jgi:hypothetical protein
VLGWLRKTAEKKGLPYQSLVNEILAEEDAEGELVELGKPDMHFVLAGASLRA